MNKLKGWIALFTLAVSWCALYWITGSRTPWNQFNISDNENSVTAYLGDIPVINYDRMGFTKALVRYIASEDGWLVGTERGELFLFNNEGRPLWKRSLGIGKLISANITNDSKIAFVGENSPEGSLFAINIKTGDILWQHKAADYVGTEAALRSHPSIVHIAVDKEDNVYANSYRFKMTKDGTRSYNAKMLAIAKDGKFLWQYPANENIDCWINWCDVNDNNGKVVISTSAYDYRRDMKYRDTLYFLDKKTGEMLNSVWVPPVPPFENTVVRSSPNYSKDGRFLAASCSDGRGLLFDDKGDLLWSRFVSKPANVDNTWINASGRDGFVTDYGVVFTTINTFNRENWQLPTPLEHPSNNSIFLFDTEGNYKYQFKAEGTMEELAFADNLVACAVGRNVRTHNYKAHGMLLVDLKDGEQKVFFPTEGPCQAIDISSDGTKVAAVEAPVLTPNGKILGAYRLHIWDVSKGGGK